MPDLIHLDGREYRFRREGLRFICRIEDTGISSGGTAPVTHAHWTISLNDESRLMRVCTLNELTGTFPRAAFEKEVIAFVRTWTAH